MNEWVGVAWHWFKGLVIAAVGLCLGAFLVAVALAAYHTWLS